MGDGKTFEELLAGYLAVKAELEVFHGVASGHAVGEVPSVALASRLLANMRARLLDLALLADCGERRGKLAVELADMDRQIWPFWERVLGRLSAHRSSESALSEIGRTR
jgi:hypothetical protein